MAKGQVVKGKGAVVNERLVPTNDGEWLFEKTYQSGAVDHTLLDFRRLTPDAASNIYRSAANSKDEAAKLKFAKKQFALSAFERRFVLAREIIPILGAVLMFVLLLGFGSAGLNYLFVGNNIYIFVGVVLALLFLVKKRRR